MTAPLGGAGPSRRPRNIAGRIIKRILVGKPISTHDELHHRLSKRIALAVFSSDALSSSAYATDEILLVLILAGSAAISKSIPISIAVALVLTVVIVSYRQTVRAYPKGGGAYIVAHENLGKYPGLIAAAALLIDYVLTVAVSLAAGVAAIGAALPVVRDNRLVVALVVVVAITLVNLRGLKESGIVFALPTYGFLFAMGVMITVGVVRVATGHYQPITTEEVHAETALSLFLILRAFASGSTALTGVEAISNGVPAFKPPESRNAASTLAILGSLLAFLFLGMTFLATRFHVNVEDIEHGKTVSSQLAGAIFGGESPPFYVIQVLVALILFLAANTSYADFPRLASILSRDRYLPRALQSRGAKLAFSQGIAILAAAASGVLIMYGADVHRIIPLYVVGVFTSFTLSQSGMVMYWWRRRQLVSGWPRFAAINSVGAVTTFVVLLVVASAKFKLGAWQVVVLIPILAWLLGRMRVHYEFVENELVLDERPHPVRAERAVILASPVKGATIKAIAFTRACGLHERKVVTLSMSERDVAALSGYWTEMQIDEEIEPLGRGTRKLVRHLKSMGPANEDSITLVVPDPYEPGKLRWTLRHVWLLWLRGRCRYLPGIVVMTVPFDPEVEPEVSRIKAPSRLALIVPVSGANRSTVQALDYAQALHPAELRAATVIVGVDENAGLEQEWDEAGIDIPLEIIDSPYRSIVDTILHELRDMRPHPDDAVGVVIPEFVVGRWWQHVLHTQPPTALLLTHAVRSEPHVMVVNVFYRLPHRRSGQSRRSGPRAEGARQGHSQAGRRR